MKKMASLAAILIIASGCGSGPESDRSGATTTVPQVVETTISAVPLGTRQDPLPPGVTVRVGDWDVTYTGALLNGTNAVLDESFFSRRPVGGREFILLQFEATYVGGGFGVWWVDVQVGVLGADDDMFGGAAEDYCGVIPNDIDATNEVISQRGIRGSECVSVPTDQLDGALIVVERALTFGDADRTFYLLTGD